MQISEGALIAKPKKEKVVAIDFIRAVCAVGIVLYHISCYSAVDAPKVLYNYANGDVGVVLIGVIPLWIWQIETDVFVISSVRNLIHCSSLFVIGMLVFKYKVFRMKPVFWICAAVSMVLLFISIPGRSQYKSIILGISLFFVLFTMGNLVMKVPVLRDGIRFVSGLTFSMFLVQNQVGYYVVERFAPSTVIRLVKVIVVTLVLCILAAWCLRAITNAVMRTKWFGWLESVVTSINKKKAEV